MKKLIIAAFALTAAASVFAQGQISFSIRFQSGTLSQTAHIWGPSATAPGLSLVGLGSNDSPVGTTPYAASGMQMIGAVGATGTGGYRTTFAQLIGLVGQNQPEGSLIPLAGVSTFRTGVGLGNIVAISSTMAGQPTSVDAPWATIRMVAWDNSSGLYPTWTEAAAAWQAGHIVAGRSSVFNVANISGTANTAPYLTSAGAIIPGLSFNLYSLQTIPEPSSFALAGLGAAALLIFRRRK